jgi:hypothetical protein
VDSFKILSLILFVINEERLKASARNLKKNVRKMKKKSQQLILYLWWEEESR